MQQNVIFNLPGTLIQVLIVDLHLTQPILAPVIGEVTIDLVDQYGRKWFACKSCEQQSPIVQVRAITVIAHTLVIILNNLYKGTHDLRKANDTDEHIANTDQDLIDRYGIVITVAYS